MVNNMGAYRSTLAESNRPQSDCSTLTKKLQKIDFAITETVLYLDAYPESKEALAYYKKLVAERAAVMARLAAAGRPTTHFENADSSEWLWIKGPWPWQSDAN